MHMIQHLKLDSQMLLNRHRHANAATVDWSFKQSMTPNLSLTVLQKHFCKLEPSASKAVYMDMSWQELYLAVRLVWCQA